MKTYEKKKEKEEEKNPHICESDLFGATAPQKKEDFYIHSEKNQMDSGGGDGIMCEYIQQI